MLDQIAHQKHVANDLENECHVVPNKGQSTNIPIKDQVNGVNLLS